MLKTMLSASPELDFVDEALFYALAGCTGIYTRTYVAMSAISVLQEPSTN